MKALIVLILMTLISCNGGGDSGATSQSPTIVTMPSVTMSFASSSGTDFDDLSERWNKSNSSVTETKTAANLNITGATNSTATYTYRGHHTSTFMTTVDIGFIGENKAGNQIDITIDYGGGDKIVRTVKLVAASYVSALHASNTATFETYVKVYSNNVVIDTSSTVSATLDPSTYDSPYNGYLFSSTFNRTATHTCIDMADAVNGLLGNPVICYLNTDLTTWGFTGNPNYSITFSAGSANTMDLAMISSIISQAQGYWE